MEVCTDFVIAHLYRLLPFRRSFDILFTTKMTAYNEVEQSDNMFNVTDMNTNGHCCSIYCMCSGIVSNDNTIADCRMNEWMKVQWIKVHSKAKSGLSLTHLYQYNWQWHVMLIRLLYCCYNHRSRGNVARGMSQLPPGALSPAFLSTVMFLSVD